MSADPLAAMPAIDPTVLTNVVCQDRRAPNFDLLDWTIKPINHKQLVATTGGIYLLSGTGRDKHGLQNWSVILKVLHNPKVSAQDPNHPTYWRRELLTFQSGILAALPEGIRAPRCYGTSETPDNGFIWMEHIVESTGRWSQAHYQQAARHAGRFAAAFLNGQALPRAPWLASPVLRTISADGQWWTTFMDPASPLNAWQSPLVQGAFNDTMQAGVVRIWRERYHFIDALERMPQVFCHYDLHRRNLMLRQGADGDSELVAIDWSYSGDGALGSDLAQLIATTIHFFEVEPTQARELEAKVLDSYLAGLHEAGWSGDPRQVRLAYLMSASLWIGATLPGWVAILLPEGSGTNVQATFGRPADAVLAGWLTLTEYVLECADEARDLMTQLS